MSPSKFAAKNIPSMIELSVGLKMIKVTRRMTFRVVSSVFAFNDVQVEMTFNLVVVQSCNEPTGHESILQTEWTFFDRDQIQ